MTDDPMEAAGTAIREQFEAYQATIAELVKVLEHSLPLLERSATEEARANKAPTGLAPRTKNKELLARARAAIAKAGTAALLP